MHPRCYGFYETKREPTLEELKEKILKINEAIESISNCELKAEVEALVIKELQEKKAELVDLMHKKVDEL